MGAPKGSKHNPTGKGGFGENPQNRNDGRWARESSVSYQYNYLIRLSISDFKLWATEHPETERTMAQQLAYEAIKRAEGDLPYLKEITDRTEGKPYQSIDLTSKGKSLGDFNERQIGRIAERIATRNRANGDTSVEG